MYNSKQGIIGSTKTKTYAKKPKLEKNIAKTKVGACVATQKKSAGFSRMDLTLNLQRFGALLLDNL